MDARVERPSWPIHMPNDKAGASHRAIAPVLAAVDRVLRRPLLALTAALVLASLFFLAFPDVDTAVSAMFYRGELGFAGTDDPDLTIVRTFGNWMTIAAVATSIVAVVGALLVRPRRWFMKPSEGLYVLAVYALGPGLIVNAVLKNTIGRARPRNLAEFGGDLNFTGVWQWGGQCVRNCSFSSGEEAAAAAIMALVFIMPRRDRLPLGLGLFAVAAMVSAARIAAGGHFLSDVLISWIIVLATIIALRPMFFGERGQRIDARFAGLRGAMWNRRSPLPPSPLARAPEPSGATVTKDYDKGAPMDAYLEPDATMTGRDFGRFATVSVVVPAKNEAENLAVLVPEIAEALAVRNHEIIVVDDGSSDGTEAVVARLRADGIAVRHIRHQRPAGQSRALRTGVLHAAGDCIVTIDGDGQNDPAFIPAMVDLLERSGDGCGLVAGQRTGRTDTFTKRLSSKAANRLRTAILKWPSRISTSKTGSGASAARTTGSSTARLVARSISSASGGSSAGAAERLETSSTLRPRRSN